MAASNPSIRRLAGRGSAHPVAPYDAHSRSIATVRTVTRCTPSAQFHPEPAVHCRTSRNGTGHSKAPHYNVRPVRSVTREANDPPHYTVRFPAAPPTRFLSSLRPPAPREFHPRGTVTRRPPTSPTSTAAPGFDDVASRRPASRVRRRRRTGVRFTQFRKTTSPNQNIGTLTYEVV